jgi:hypothetical protein
MAQRAVVVSATPAAQLARIKVGHPEYAIERLTSGWLVARRGAEKIVVPTIPDLELRLNEKKRKQRGGKRKSS